MYAVIQTGGKQYRVAPGDRLQVETIEAAVGSEVEFGGLLAVSSASGELITGSGLANAKVVATISGHGRAAKVIVFKFKRKKQYRRTQGHRQNFTEVTVSDVLV
jgi:large subunit ribosomal protein L21